MGRQVNITALLSDMFACGHAVAWVNGRDPRAAWFECPRGDWLAFFLVGVGYDRRTLVGHLISLARELVTTTHDLADLNDFAERLSHSVPPISDEERPAINQLCYLARELGAHKTHSFGDRRNAPAAAHAFVFMLAGSPPSSEAQRTADILRDLVPWSEVEVLIEQWAKDKEKDVRG